MRRFLMTKRHLLTNNGEMHVHTTRIHVRHETMQRFMCMPHADMVDMYLEDEACTMKNSSSRICCNEEESVYIHFISNLLFTMKPSYCAKPVDR